MNRKELKSAAAESIAVCSAPLKRFTLLYLLCCAALIALDYGVTELVSHTGSGSQHLSQLISTQTTSYLVTATLSFVCQMLLVLLGIGYQAMALDLSRREDVALSALWTGLRFWTKGILLFLSLSLLVGLWSSIAIMPVSYVLSALFIQETVTQDQLMFLMLLFSGFAMWLISYRYRMSYFIFLDTPEKPVRQIIAEAKATCRGHFTDLLLLDLSFLPWFLLCILTLGVLLIWKLPYIVTTYAHAYDYLLEDAERLRQRLEEIWNRRRQAGSPSQKE